MAKGTLLCLALLSLTIALMYRIQAEVVHSFMSFGDIVDSLIIRISSTVAVGFAIAVLILESYKKKKQ